MEGNTIDYAAVLEDLEKDLTELVASISYIKRKKLGQAVDVRMTPGSASLAMNGVRGSIAQDAFFGLSLVEATQKYLSIVKAPKTAREIAEALAAGGFKTTSKDFNNTVFSVLSREDKNEGAIAKVNTGFGLAMWYPGLKRVKSPIKASQEQPVDATADEGGPAKEFL